MILTTHIVLAISSLIMATVALKTPSTAKLRTTYSLSSMTLISGTYLVASTHASMLSACISGLVYLGVIVALLLSAQNKLAVIRNK